MKGIERLHRLLQDRKVGRIHLKHRVQHPEEYQRIDRVLQQFRTAGGLKHDYQAYEPFSL